MSRSMTKSQFWNKYHTLGVAQNLPIGRFPSWEYLAREGVIPTHIPTKELMNSQVSIEQYRDGWLRDKNIFFVRYKFENDRVIHHD